MDTPKEDKTDMWLSMISSFDQKMTDMWLSMISSFDRKKTDVWLSMISSVDIIVAVYVGLPCEL